MTLIFGRASIVFLIIILFSGCCYTSLSSNVVGLEKQGLSVLPANQITTPGGVVTYEIHVHGAKDPIKGEYVTISTTTKHDSITCTITPNNKAAPFIATMTVHVSSSTKPGTYSITVVATSTSEKARTHSETVQLTVMPLITATIITTAQTTTFPTVSTPTVTTPPIITRTITPTYTITEMPDLPPFDFILQIIPSSVEVFRGDTAYYQVIIEYSAPEYYGTPIDVEVINLIPGMTWFHNSTGLYIFTNSDSPLGTHNFQVFGSALGVTHGVDGTIPVTEGLPPEEEDHRLREEEPLREEDPRRPEEEERRAEEEERDRMDEETSTLFAKLRLSLIDPAISMSVLTMTAAILGLALAYQVKRAKVERGRTRLEEAEEALEKPKEECPAILVEMRNIIMWIVIVIATVTIITYAIFLSL